MDRKYLINEMKEMCSEARDYINHTKDSDLRSLFRMESLIVFAKIAIRKKEDDNVLEFLRSEVEFSLNHFKGLNKC